MSSWHLPPAWGPARCLCKSILLLKSGNSYHFRPYRHALRDRFDAISVGLFTLKHRPIFHAFLHNLNANGVSNVHRLHRKNCSVCLVILCFRRATGCNRLLFLSTFGSTRKTRFGDNYRERVIFRSNGFTIYYANRRRFRTNFSVGQSIKTSSFRIRKVHGNVDRNLFPFLRLFDLFSHFVGYTSRMRHTFERVVILTYGSFLRTTSNFLRKCMSTKKTYGLFNCRRKLERRSLCLSYTNCSSFIVVKGFFRTRSNSSVLRFFMTLRGDLCTTNRFMVLFARGVQIGSATNKIRQICYQVSTRFHSKATRCNNDIRIYGCTY